MNEEIVSLARNVVIDYGHVCDHPLDCDCSMARLGRALLAQTIESPQRKDAQ